MRIFDSAKQSYRLIERDDGNEKNPHGIEKAA